MNLPSTATSSVTSTSASSDSASNLSEICDDCKSRDSWIIHSARLRGTLRSFCTHCLLRNHPASFCPSCFAFYDSSPPHTSRRISCSSCLSLTHIQCVSDAKSASYLCPPCQSPDSFSFFRPIIGPNGARSLNKSLSEAFLCAAKISAFSMNKAVSAAKCEAERRGREAALARKRAREALEHVVTLDGKEKARSGVPKIKEASFDNRDQKPKPSPNGVVKESVTTNSGQMKNNGSTEKQNPAIQMTKVKLEGDSSK